MLYLLLFLPSVLFAHGFIDSYSSVLSFTHGMLSGICFLSGGAMLAGSVAQFKMFWDNPSEVKLKIPVTLLVLGAVLLLLAHIQGPF